MTNPLKSKFASAAIETAWDWTPPEKHEGHKPSEESVPAKTSVPALPQVNRRGSQLNRRGSQLAGWLPFANWNLRRNPFGELTARERAEVAVCDLSDWYSILHQPRQAVELVGRKGRGKSTRLLKFHFENEGSSYQYLPPRKIVPDWLLPCNDSLNRLLDQQLMDRSPICKDRGGEESISDGTVVIIDEAQRMSWRTYNAVVGSGRPLLLSTHFSIASLLRIRGYRVHSFRVGHDNDAPMIAKAMNARIEASRLGPGPLPQITVQRAAQWRLQFGSNIRAIESALYERVQRDAREGLGCA